MPPAWMENIYDTGLTIRDASNEEQILLDLNSVSSDPEDDPIQFNIEPFLVPGQDISWQKSVFISDNSVLKTHNLQTNDPENDGAVDVSVKASATGGSNTTVIRFLFIL